MIATAKRARVSTGPKKNGSAPDRPPGLLAAGVLLGSFGVAVAMAPGAYNPFGPVKAFVLLLAAALVAAGLAGRPDLLRDAWAAARKLPAVWASAALLLIAALATITSVDPWQSLIGHYPEYRGLLLLFVAAAIGVGAFASARAPSAWRVLGLAAALAVLVVSAYALLQYVGVDPVPSLLEFTVRRVRSTLGNASNLGVFLVMTLPIVIARAREERAAWRWVSWVAAGAGTIVLALTLSRGAWAGAGAGAIVWLLAEGRRWDRARRTKVALAAAGAAVALMAAVALLVPNAGARIAELGDPSAGTAGWRTEVWSISTRMVADRPILGFGPGSFRYSFPAYRTAATMAGENGSQVLEDPHNVFVSAAVATGVPGLLAFVAMLFTVLAAAWRIAGGTGHDRSLAGPALAAALAGGLVALQFHFLTLDTAPLLAVWAGFALAHETLEPAQPGKSAPAPAIRWLAAALSAVLAVGAFAAGGLVLADYSIASGFALTDAHSPWPVARAEFERARALAPWEPAIEWALGRAATQVISSTGDTSAFPDAEAAMLSTSLRLPADPLVVAQTAEAYLVAGLASKDRTELQRALSLAEGAVALDPENGYRWDAKGTALAALGETQAAISAFRAAVQYAPDDRQAWVNLASVYGRVGDTVKAADAQRHADALPGGP
jgi:O-antigen ligase